MKNVFFVGFLCVLSFCQVRENEEQIAADTSGFTFAFLTDIHLQPERNAATGFQQAISRVNELNPDFVITGGDLIMDALGVTYERADSLYDMYMESAKNLNMPVYNSIGNHEVYGLYEESGSDTTHTEYGKGMFESRLGKRYYSFDHKGWHFMILDAIGMTPERKYIGHIDDEQVEWITSDLANIDKSTPVVISVHIPFITTYTQLTRGTQAANGPGMVITNGTDVLKLFLPYNLRLVLQGHLHFLEDLYIDNRIHFITAGAVSGRWWQGRLTDHSEEGFLLVRASGETIDWDYVDYGWEVTAAE